MHLTNKSWCGRMPGQKKSSNAHPCKTIIRQKWGQLKQAGSKTIRSDHACWGLFQAEQVIALATTYYRFLCSGDKYVHWAIYLF